MKKLLFLSIITLFSKLSFCQTENAATLTPENDPKLAEFRKHAMERRVQQQSTNQNTSTYFGYDEILKSYLVDGVIPAAVPRYEPNISKKDYVGKLNQWILANKTFLKPEHKNSLITE